MEVDLLPGADNALELKTSGSGRAGPGRAGPGNGYKMWDRADLCSFVKYL
jgi:hypothetical protein